MKNISLLISTCIFFSRLVCAQTLTSEQREELSALIDQYSRARETKDTVLLKNILTSDVDQLVSSGEWRRGVSEAVKGMLRSSESNSGTRTLMVDKARLLTAQTAVVDARYEIQNADGTLRKMWSTFLLVNQNGKWRIAGIRNMLPQR